MTQLFLLRLNSEQMKAYNFYKPLYWDMFIIFLLAVAFFLFFFLNRFTLCFIFDPREIFNNWNYCKMYIYPSEIIHYDVSLLHYHLLFKHTCGLC